MKLLRLIDGLRLGYQEWGVANSAFSKRILALHGWLDNSNSFIYLGPYLASKGYHVVAIDHVGHGQSDHFGNGGPYFNQKFAMVVRNSMDALGWESSHLLCHSMGANVGMVYAATYVEKVEKLMLIEGFGPVTEPAENTVRILRRAIDSERSLKLKNTKPKLYPNLARAVEARQMVVSTYPGQQFLSREAAFALVSR